MQKWEYLTLESSRNYGVTKYYINNTMQTEFKNKPMVEVMNLIGAQGFELVGIASDKDGHTFVFKRPVATTAPLQRPKAPEQKPAP